MKDMSETSTVRIGALTLRFLVDETQGAGQLVMFEFEVPPKVRVPVQHFHRDVDEAVYGLGGIMTTRIDGTAHEIRPGGSAFIPRGAVHIHENLHDTPARVLVVMTPGSIGRGYFEEMAATVNVPGAPDVAKLKGIMERHGLIAA